ncbi:MAG: DUF6061 family protein, partial [Lachnospiraceae bacterium]|nr:DUF6061 family protein [Lachnospiraceae bacterium]
MSVAGVKKGFCFKCEDCGEEFALDDTEYSDGVKCPKCGGAHYTAASRSGMFFEVMRLLDETEKNSPENSPKVLMAENVKGLKPYIPILEQEFQKRGYTAHVQLFNSKYWNVPQNRERYYIVGVKLKLHKLLDDKPMEYVAMALSGEMQAYCDIEADMVKSMFGT